MQLRLLYSCIIVSVLPIGDVLCQECQSEIQLNSNDYVSSVTVSGSQLNTDDVNDLLEFDNIDRTYCAPTNRRPFTMTISYSSPVLLTEIGIHGYDGLLNVNDFVTEFSLSFSEDGSNFTDYIQGVKSTPTVFHMPCYERHYFILCSPITASSMRITVRNWENIPCMSLLMMGCNYSDVVNGSDKFANRTFSDTSPSQVDEVVVTSTEPVMPTVSFTATITQAVTESFTVYRTVTVTDLYYTPSPSPKQSSDAAGSTSCSSSDTDNTPIYVAVAIVIVGLLITITVVVVGVLVCHRHQKEKDSDESSVPLNLEYKNANGIDTSKVSIIEVDNDLYGKEMQSQSGPVSPEDNEHAHIVLYDEVDVTKKEPAVMETADNPQYGDTMKQSDVADDPKSSDNVYSYAIP